MHRSGDLVRAHNRFPASLGRRAFPCALIRPSEATLSPPVAFIMLLLLAASFTSPNAHDAASALNRS